MVIEERIVRPRTSSVICECMSAVFASSGYRCSELETEARYLVSDEEERKGRSSYGTAGVNASGASSTTSRPPRDATIEGKKTQ